MATMESLIESLCTASRKTLSDPYADFRWPESLDREQWFTSPELISLYGTPTYEELDDRTRKQLSFFEAVNFYSLNIHGEKPLVEGLSRLLYSAEHRTITSYLHHFLDEENKHMVYFGGFCTRYAGKIYPDRKVVFPREYADGEEDFLFFAKVLIFEEIVDVYNVRMMKDERLVPIARDINRMHHLEETRHLAFGRAWVREAFQQYSKRWSADTVRGVGTYLAEYMKATWGEYSNPDVYRDAGLPDPMELRREVLRSERCREHRRAVSDKAVRLLLDCGILQEEPEL